MVPRIGKRTCAATIAIGIAAVLLCPAGRAQMVLDGSLGAGGPLAGPNFSIGAGLGQQVGGNLFHSFSMFNVNTGQSATFHGPASVGNIIGRVTGGSASNIDGTLRMGPGIVSANLYLINPSGLVFGPNAFLDVKGSFHASTADYLKLGASGTFHAANPAASTLTSAPPSAFGFLAANPAPIQVNDSFLPVPAGQSLSLLGGDVSIRGGQFGAFLLASGGRINLASAAGPGELSLAAGAIAASAGQALGRIDISDAFVATGSGSSGLPSGPVYIRGGSIVLTDQTLIGGANKAGGAGGGVSLVASGEVRVVDSYLDGSSSGAGKGGGVSIAAAQAVVGSGAVFSTSASSSGDAGDITLNVGRLEVLAGGFVSAGTLSGSSGAAGRVSMNASEAIVVEGVGGGFPSAISALSGGTGRAGDIELRAPFVAIDNGGAVLSAAVASGVGGNITIDAGRVQLSGGVLGSPATSASGTGGNVTIRASESVLVRDVPGRFALIHVFTAGSGDAGDISITAPLVRMEGGHISSATTAAGRGGSVMLDASRIEILGGGFIDTNSSGLGAGGSVRLQATDSILLQGRDAGGLRSAVTALSDGPGQAGSIFISGPLLTLDGGVLASPTSAAGNAGTIAVNVGRLEILGGGSINVKSTGSGNAGSIVIDAGQRLEMSGGSAITTEATSADGGDIRIVARELVYLQDSRITTSVGTGAGNGGNIFIDPTFVILDNSQIIANAFGGNGGNITIVSDFFIADAASRVQASSQLGVSGSVVIAAPQTDVASSATVLPSAFFDASALMRESCAARAGRAANSFMQVGRGGLAAQPSDLAYGDYGWRGPAPRAATPPPSAMRLAYSGCAGG